MQSRLSPLPDDVWHDPPAVAGRPVRGASAPTVAPCASPETVSPETLSTLSRGPSPSLPASGDLSTEAAEPRLSMAAWREALRLWLTWNRAHEQATARLFKLGEDPRQVEATLDQLDQLRAQAIALSEQVLAEVDPQHSSGTEAGNPEPLDTRSLDTSSRGDAAGDAAADESAAGDSPTA